ncbi:thioredoxin [Seonamhaeicola sp. S2-3]|uniref:redoxin domain-containing protein n=1 Tax=Seonamhaeicola sp. S2-3 TaxID=1936081 RepID=UPI000972D09E|nr:redoxin domain-containing protein [Seonamhaeicola sp. S2-3]APY10112.1 thioredoxin [Seonamhaeicola sp. S2-3]
MKTKLLFVAILIMASCNNNNKDSKTSLTVKETTEKEVVNKGGDDLEIYDFNGLQPLLNKTDDTVYVINFWATWCAPCVKELPYFEDLYANYKDDNVEVILVSLDFPHQFETKLKPFIKKNKLQAKVVVLDDVDSNSWIPKVNKDWSGSIPATIIYKNDKRSFFEKSFTYNELENELKKFLN